MKKSVATCVVKTKGVRGIRVVPNSPKSVVFEKRRTIAFKPLKRPEAIIPECVTLYQKHDAIMDSYPEKEFPDRKEISGKQDWYSLGDWAAFARSCRTWKHTRKTAYRLKDGFNCHKRDQAQVDNYNLFWGQCWQYELMLGDKTWDM